MSKYCVNCGMPREDHPFLNDEHGHPALCVKFVAKTAPKPICIVESPYAGDTARNLIYLRRALEYCFDSGYLPLASHAMFTQVLDDKLPDQRKRGIEWGYEYWQCAEVVIFFCDYGMSPGMEKAWERATQSDLMAIQILIGENP